MNLRSQIVIELEKNDRIYTFCMPFGAPYGESYDAAFEMLQKIVQMAKQAAEQAKLQEPDKDVTQMINGN